MKIVEIKFLAICGKKLLLSPIRNYTMKKSKIILLCLAILFIADFLQAKTSVSFNGRYTNVIYSINDYLWRDRNKYSFEDIQKECENQPENPDVWYIAGFYWRYKAHNREKAAECYKKSMELAPNVLKSTFSYAETACYRQNPEVLFNILTNSFHYIKESYYTVAWSGCLDYFNKSETNYLDKLYVFIQNKKNKIPDGDYALFMISMRLGKYDIFLACAERLMKKTENSIIKHNVKNFVEFIGMDINNNPELMAIRNRILNKSQSPYQQAMQKIKDAQNKHDNPELFVLTSNAFELAANQSQRIDALHELVFYCPNSQKEKIKRFLEKIAEEKVTSFSRISKMAWYFKKIGATNDLYIYLNKAITQMPTNIGRDVEQIMFMTYEFYGPARLNKSDEEILKLTIEHFKTNYDAIKKIADVYQKYKFYDDELHCRKIALKIAGNKDEISKTKARIDELKIKFGQSIDNEKFISDNLEKAEESSAAAKAVCAFYLSKGKTNSALDVLLKCVRNTEFPIDRRAAIEAVLNTQWGGYEEKALDSLFQLFYKKNHYNRSFAGKIMWKYIDAGLEEKGFDTFILIAKNNDRPYKYEKAIKRLNANILVNRIISEEVTNSYLLLRTSYILNADNNKPEAYKLRNYFINLPDKDPRKYSAATEMIKYAINNGDTNLCLELVDKIDGFVKQKIIPKSLPDNLYYYMAKLNLKDKCDLWIDFILENIDDKTLKNQLYYYAKWYMRTGETNKLRNFLAKNCSTNLPTGDLFDLLRVFKYLNDTNQYKLYVETIGTRLTNGNLVRIYSANYLDNLNYLSRISGKNYDEKIDEFVQKWFYSDKVSINTKFSLLYRAKSNKIEYVNYLAKNKSKLSDGRLMDIARMFIRYGITNRGIEFYSCIVDSSKAKDNNKINAILNLAPIYINNKKYQEADNVLIKLSQFNLAEKNHGFFSNLGSLYSRAFMYGKAVDCYIEAINRAKKNYNVESAVMNIANMWRYNSEIEYSKLAETNFTNKNEILNYMAKALFSLLANNTFDAEEYILKAEEKLKTNKEKYSLWNAWKNVALVNNNYEAQLFGYKKMLQYNENYNKYNIIYDINRLLRKTTNYTELIYFNSDILNVVTNERRRDEIILNICDAYLRLVDTNAAWETVLQSNNAETIKRFAYRINKSNEMMHEFEKRIEKAGGRDFTIMAITLSQYNWKNKKLSEKLASLLDEKMPEINVRDYVDLSMIYLNCGYRDKAKNLLDKYVDNLNEKYQDDGRKMIYKYLDLKWRQSLRFRGSISRSGDLQRLWGRR